VLGGGAANGAWEAGLLWGFTHFGDPNDYKYDVVTGVSIGSMNAILLAGYPKGQEYQASETLS
jgi:predicted acylesterase/phospholipase RssA